jgi:4-hydroxy-2-oxoheptanedioate aldolase
MEASMSSDVDINAGRQGYRTRWAIGVAVIATSWLAVGPSAEQSAKPKVRLNQIIEQLEQGKPAFATEHWQLLEMEHGPYQIEQVTKILADLRPEGAARPKLTPVVRIPLEGDEVFKSTIKQVLDQGVMGVIVPHVRTAAEATRIVEAMRYPPQRGAKHPQPAGIRGWGPTRAARYWGLTPPEYAQRADVWPLNPEGELLAIAMIESRTAVDNIDAILKVPGLGGILIGPADLSLSLGVGNPGGNPQAPEVEAATATVAKACVARKVVACGTFESPNPTARIAQGFRLFTRSSSGK